MTRHYRLDEYGDPVEVDDLADWMRSFNTNRVILVHDTIQDTLECRLNVTDISISTIFLGVDHRFGVRDGIDRAPVLFETMIFGGEYDQTQERTCTLEQAYVMHERCIQLCADAYGPAFPRHLKMTQKAEFKIKGE